MLKILNGLQEKGGFLKDFVTIFGNYQYFSPFIPLGNLKQEFAWWSSSLRLTLVRESMSAGPLTLILSTKKRNKIKEKREIVGLQVFARMKAGMKNIFVLCYFSVFVSTTGFIHQLQKTENSCSNSVLIKYFSHLQYLSSL